MSLIVTTALWRFLREKELDDQLAIESIEKKEIHKLLEHICPFHSYNEERLLTWALRSISKDVHLLEDIARLPFRNENSLKMLFCLAIVLGAQTKVLQLMKTITLSEEIASEILIKCIENGGREEVIHALASMSNLKNKRSIGYALLEAKEEKLLAQYKDVFQLDVDENVRFFVCDYLKQPSIAFKEKFFHIKQLLVIFPLQQDILLSIAFDCLNLATVDNARSVLKYFADKLEVANFGKLFLNATILYPTILGSEETKRTFLFSLDRFSNMGDFKRIIRKEKRKVFLPDHSERASLYLEELRQDCLYAEKKMPKEVLLYTIMRGGFGDLAATLKLAETISKEDRFTKITLVFPRGIDEKRRDFLRRWPAKFEVVSPQVLDRENVMAIGIATHQNIFETTRRDIPHFFVREYDALLQEDISNQCCSGLGEQKLGIFVDDDMQGILSTREIEILQRISSNSKLLFEEKKFYFGYGHYFVSIEHFVHLVVSAEKDKDEDIIVFIKLGDCGPLSASFTLDGNFFEFLKRRNIGGLIIDDHEYHLQKGKKSLIVFFMSSSIGHEEMKVLLKASKDLCLVTGDQSFSEAVSADKLIIYEMYSHKVKLWHNFCRLAKEHVGSDLQDILLESGIEVSSPNAYDDCEYDGLAAKLLAEKSEYSRLNQFVIKNRALNRRLILKIKRLFAEIQR